MLTKEKLDNLPEEIRSLLTSSDLDDTVSDIGERNNLHIDQIGMLDHLVKMVIIGEVKRSDLNKQMEILMDIDNDLSNKLIAELNDRIFQPTNEVLRQTHNEEDKVMEDNFSSNDVMNVISDPTSLPTNSRIYEKETVPETPEEKQPEVNAEIPQAPVPNTESTPHEDKLTKPTHSQSQTKTINVSEKSSLIPSDHRDRINNDPYKESLN